MNEINKITLILRTLDILVCFKMTYYLRYSLALFFAFKFSPSSITYHPNLPFFISL